MSRMRMAAAIGAAIAVIWATLDGGPPPLSALLDPFNYFAGAFIALGGAFTAITLVLAWGHARHSPRWLLATLGGLLLLSIPSLWSFAREARATRRFLASADSTSGVVTAKYYRGAVHLHVEYRVAGEVHKVMKWGANPYVGTPAFSDWERGDTIPVYYQRATPEVALVGRPGPNPRILVEALAKLWIVCGVLLTAYLPLAGRRIRRLPLMQGARVRQAQG